MGEPLTTIRNRLAEIAALRKTLEAEEQELLIAERVVARLEAVPKTNSNGASHRADFALTSPEMGRVEVFEVKLPATLSQKDYILSTLRTMAETWAESSTALHETIKKVHNKDIPKGSYQPLLWQLKNDKLIVRDGAKIALAERVKEAAAKIKDEVFS